YCRFAVLGKTTEEQKLKVTDSQLKSNAIDIPLDVVFGKPPKMTRKFKTKKPELKKLDIKMELSEAAEEVLKVPSVGSKAFLITIGDRTVGGMTVRDQMVGPHQVPVADAAITANSFEGHRGEAMAIGERTPVALINPAASARMAVAEVVTNIASARIQKI